MNFLSVGLNDIAGADKLPYKQIAEPGMVKIETLHGLKYPVEVSAEILTTLRFRAENTFDEDIYGAVITVPAYFDDAQRQASKDAAELAGLNVLRLINEPTATAVTYGLDTGAEGVYAVYDLGGGTFDISILRLSQGVFEVLSTGGDDYDAALAEFILAQTAKTANTAAEKAQIKVQARHVKEQLSTIDSVAIIAGSTGAKGQFDIRKADFEQITSHLTAKTLHAVRKALRDAKLSKEDIQGVVMVGGSTRMPQVQRAVHEFFGKPPLNNLNPDEVVALGAAISANQLAGNNSLGDLLLLDVIPLSLGIETMGELSERIIPRNTTIPTAMAQDFTPYQDGQTALSLHLIQGERDLVKDCRSLARFTLRGIPPMVAGAARIRVTFTVDADGLLTVDAKEQISGVETSIDVKPSYGLSDDEIARLLQDSFGAAQKNMAARALAEARLETDRMVLATRSAMAADGDLLSAEDRTKIDALIQAAISGKAFEDVAKVEAATKALADGTEAFAAERMNAGIQRALTGKTVDTM